MRTRLVITAACFGLAGASLLGGCSGWNDDRGRGDAPSDQQPDQRRVVYPNADQFPNIAAFCTSVGGNGIYTTTRQAPPVVVVDDPECDGGGALLPD